jgi:FecR protein
MYLTKTSLFKTSIIAACLFGAQAALANTVGSITFKAGDASIIHADKSVIAAEKNTELNAGDTVATKEGRVQLTLLDGGRVSLQPNTVYRINKYEFSGKEDGSEFAFTELLKGGLRTVSGLIGHKNRDRYQLKTAVATIGIRGTEFTVNYNDEVLLMTTNHGSVDVCNQGGCLNAITGQTIVVNGVGASPKPSSKAATAAAAPAGGDGGGKAVFAADEAIAADVAVAVEAAKNAPPAGLPTSGTVVALSTKDRSGQSNSQVFKATSIVYGAGNALVSATDGNTSLLLGSATYKSAGDDGVAAWGQADSGSPVTRYDYIIGATPNVLALGAAGLTATYNVGEGIGASSAPYLSTTTGGLSTLGAANTVTGNLTANFGSGIIGYNFNIPTNTGTTYTALGNGTIDANAAFKGVGDNNKVIGGFLGTNAERAGLVYVIDAPNANGTAGGTVNGSVVLAK